MDFFLGFGYYETLLQTFTCMFSVDMLLFLLDKHLMFMWTCWVMRQVLCSSSSETAEFFQSGFITLSFHQ